MKRNSIVKTLMLSAFLALPNLARSQDAGLQETLTEEPQESAEAGQEQEGVEPWLPETTDDTGVNESGEDLDSLPPVDDLPYAKGDMELGFGLGALFGSGYFSMAVGAEFAYYIVPRLAPGLALEYQATFGDLKYPQSFTTLPYLKFVIIRSRTFAPYIVAAGGRDFQWAGTNDIEKGYCAVDSWIAGGGVGAHIGLGSRFAVKLQVLFLYYFFDETVVIAGENTPVDGHLYIPITIGMSFLI